MIDVSGRCYGYVIGTYENEYLAKCQHCGWQAQETGDESEAQRLAREHTDPELRHLEDEAVLGWEIDSAAINEHWQ